MRVVTESSPGEDIVTGRELRKGHNVTDLVFGQMHDEPL
jgi:hypothetical protein